MTNKLTLALVLMAAVSAFSHELATPPKQPHFSELKVGSSEPFTKYDSNISDPSRKGSKYFRVMTYAQFDQSPEIIPGSGMGYRQALGNAAVDFSINFSRRQGKNRVHDFWTAPKVTYLRYLSPSKNQSLYAGAGIAWGGTEATYNLRDFEFQVEDDSRDSYFVGLIPHVTVGYELLRHSMILSFTELTISQPLFSSLPTGPNPGPVAELSIGAGF